MSEVTFDPSSGNMNFWTQDSYVHIDDGTRYPLTSPDDSSYVYCSGTANDIVTSWGFGKTEQDYYVQNITLWQRKSFGVDVPSGQITLGTNTFDRTQFNTVLGPPWYYAEFNPEDHFPSGFIPSGTDIQCTLTTPELGTSDVAAIDSLYISLNTIDPGDWNGWQPLFMQGAFTTSGTHNLYIQGSPKPFKFVDLYTQGPFNEFFLDSGNAIGPTGGAGPTLYTISYVEQSGGINLFMKLDGSGEYNSVPLSIFSGSGFSNNIPLFIGSSYSSGDFILFMQGLLASEYKKNNNISLFTGAATGDYLFTVQTSFGTSGTLFIHGGNGDITTNMNMYALGGFGETGQGVTLDLFVQNDYELAKSGSPLFIEGSPIRQSGHMNLFMNREVDSTSNNFSLFLDGRDSSPTGSISLSIFGVEGIIDSGVSFYIGGYGSGTDLVKLYVHGRS